MVYEDTVYITLPSLISTVHELFSALGSYNYAITRVESHSKFQIVHPHFRLRVGSSSVAEL